MTQNQSCDNTDCGCSGVSRRDFVRAVGAGAAVIAIGATGTGAMAGPFDPAAFDALVPADKALKPEWVKSLFERGEPAWHTGKSLKFIGMPVGGICAGQVYLGGDGRLWRWDIFNQHIGTGAEHYAQPLNPEQPFAVGFALRTHVGGKAVVRTLDETGFPGVRFRGEYPIGQVDYHDAESPVAVSLEAFSPFIPLKPEDSAFPATIMRFTLKNNGKEATTVEIAGWLENAVCLLSGKTNSGLRRNQIVREPALAMLECSVASTAKVADKPARADVIFEDFEKETYEGWKVEGTAFGDGPIERAKIPSYQGDVGGEGKRVVNSHNTRHGESVADGDAHTGKLTSKSFAIERQFISFYIGGGNNPGLTCLNLVIDGKVARAATGMDDNHMRRAFFDVRDLQGKTGVIEIVDDKKSGWGNIGVDQIVFTDQLKADEPLEKQPDFGSMALAILDAGNNPIANSALLAGDVSANAFEDLKQNADQVRPFAEKLVGSIGRTVTLKPDESQTISFVIAWNFPNLKLPAAVRDAGRHYATRFDSAGAVVRHLAKNAQSLYEQTRLWRDTWYDSSLPYWFLDRTFANTSILATSTCYQFADGRFYSWEGVGCCEGTCTHVWNYSHAMGRIFPQLERDLRERTDYGLAFRPDGIINFRGEVSDLAIDGQSGCILRTYREHQMSADDTFLRRLWPKIKLAVQCLINQPGGKEGILRGGQMNTLDTQWFGPAAWLSGMYLAAVRAGEEMAIEAGDPDFAKECRTVFDAGRKRLVPELFDGEYFYNKPDPQRADTINSGSGCEIDQLLGQSWSFQVGLGRIFPETEARTALKSLWRYNFAPNVARFREANKLGRWYAMPGEAGLLMCTFPRQDWNYRKAAGRGPDWAAGYFNECMNGFEHQVAGHMIWEGLVQEGLAVERAIHDRYGAERRNPWNEIECGDHYARSMASYGVYLAACGFAYHGPKGHMALAPKLTPENFKAAFTAAESWGSISQRRNGAVQEITIAVKQGALRLRSVGFELLGGVKADKIQVRVADKIVNATRTITGASVGMQLASDVTIKEKESLHITVSA